MACFMIALKKMKRVVKKNDFFKADSGMITVLKSAIFFFAVLYNVAAT